MKHSSQKSMSAKLSRTSIIVLAIALVVLTASVVTALSMRTQSTSAKPQVEARAQKMTSGNKNLVTSNASGQIVVLDRQTGQSRPLTSDEARILAEGIKQLVNQSTEGLVQVQHANGTVSMNLQGRFQNVLLAKKEADGTITQACVDNPEAAAAFFEIDPALLGLKSQPVSKSANPKLEDR
jgi:biopolymer transport protein ExbD